MKKYKKGGDLDKRLAKRKKKQDARLTAKKARKDSQNASDISRAKSQADVKNIRSSAKGVASRNKGYSSRADEVKKVTNLATDSKVKVKSAPKTKNKNFTGDRRVQGDNTDSHNTRTRTSNNTRSSKKSSVTTRSTTKVDNSVKSKSNNQSPNQSPSQSSKASTKKTNRSGVNNNQSKSAPKRNSSLPKKPKYPRGTIQVKKTGGRVIKGNSLRFTRKK